MCFFFDWLPNSQFTGNTWVEGSGTTVNVGVHCVPSSITIISNWLFVQVSPSVDTHFYCLTKMVQNFYVFDAAKFLYCYLVKIKGCSIHCQKGSLKISALPHYGGFQPGNPKILHWRRSTFCWWWHMWCTIYYIYAVLLFYFIHDHCYVAIGVHLAPVCYIRYLSQFMLHL